MVIEEALARAERVVEAVRSAAPVLDLATEVRVDMPIIVCVVEVVSGRAGVREMGESLLARHRKCDGWEIALVCPGQSRTSMTRRVGFSSSATW